MSGGPCRIGLRMHAYTYILCVYMYIYIQSYLSGGPCRVGLRMYVRMYVHICIYVHIRMYIQSYLSGGPCQTGHPGCAPSCPRSRTRPIGTVPSGRMTLPGEREREEKLVRKKLVPLARLPVIIVCMTLPGVRMCVYIKRVIRIYTYIHWHGSQWSYDATWCVFVCEKKNHPIGTAPNGPMTINCVCVCVCVRERGVLRVYLCVY